ncbi:MAG: GNAT family N-acetyltransferase [Verrucomicrobiota bacterium]
MHPIDIREAVIEDAEGIAPLIVELGYRITIDDLKSQMRTYSVGGDSVLVAVDAEEIIGFLSLHFIPFMHATGGLCRITAMSVSSRYRMKGVGRSLLNKAESVASSLGGKRLEVTSGDHRKEDAHIFYQSCGFRLSDRRFLKDLT